MKVVGYCSDCKLPLSQQEVGSPCGRCGYLNDGTPLSDVPMPPVTKQTGKDLLKRNYKIQTAGVKNGGTTVKKPSVRVI